MRVLIVEDEVKLAGIIRRGMRAHGLSADVAVCGEDALWMAAATDYSVVVLDLMLPGIDGFETCRRLRADDYLPKPFAFDELLGFISSTGRFRFS